MGLLLSVLVGCVGAVELVSCLHYISDEWLLYQLRTRNKQAIDAALSKYQDEIKLSLVKLEKSRFDGEDNFIDGYRIDNSEISEELRLKFQDRIKEIIRLANIENSTDEESESSETSSSTITATTSTTTTTRTNDENERTKEIKTEISHNGFPNFNLENHNESFKIFNEENENIVNEKIEREKGSHELKNSDNNSVNNSSKNENTKPEISHNGSSNFNLENERLENENLKSDVIKNKSANINSEIDDMEMENEKMENKRVDSQISQNANLDNGSSEIESETIHGSSKAETSENEKIFDENSIHKSEIHQTRSSNSNSENQRIENDNRNIENSIRESPGRSPNFISENERMENENAVNELIEKELQEELLNTEEASFSNQSSSLDPDNSFPDIHFDEYDRPSQYSDDYLRTLDGVKGRPLVRDDGTGRRRAFKKRNSSSSSSKDSKASREEELRLFTSLEEAEFESMKSEYVPITYSSEPDLKVKKHRRHKKNSVPDMETTIEIDEIENDKRALSYDMLDQVGGEEVTHPWGDIKPELRRDSDYFRRMGKESSIDEVDEIDEIEQTEREIREHFSKFKLAEENDDAKSMKSTYYDDDHNLNVTNLVETAMITTERSKTPAIPRTDSFEDATDSQHNEVIDILKKRGQSETTELNKNETENLTKDNSKERYIWGVTPKKDINVSSSECDPVGLNAFINAERSTSFSSTNPEKELNIKNVDVDDVKKVEDVTVGFSEFSTRLEKIEKEIDQKISDWMGQGDDDGDDDDDDDNDHHSNEKIKDNFTINDLISHEEFLQDIQMNDHEKDIFECEIKEIDDHDIKIDEFTKYIKNLDQQDANNIDDESNKNVNDDNEDDDDDDDDQDQEKEEIELNIYESDEEPFFGNDPKKIKKQKKKSVIDLENIDKGIVIDSSIVFDEYDVETNEDFSYLPELGTEDLFRLDSDEEPLFETVYDKIVDDLDLEIYEDNKGFSSDAYVELKSDSEKRQKIRKHKKPSVIDDNPSESDDNSISGNETSTRRVHSRHRRRGKIGGPRETNDMKDDICDINEDFSYLKKLGNEQDFILESDEEPCLRSLFMVDAKEDIGIISQSSSGEYLLLQMLSSDEEPSRDQKEARIKKQKVRSTGAIPKGSTQTFTEKLIDFERKYLDDENIDNNDQTPVHLGLVREYTLDSDEEPYYRENKIIYDDGDSDDEDYISYLHRIYGEHHSEDEPCNRDFCRCRMFIEHERRVLEEREYDEERRLRLYDEYEIEQNEHYYPEIGNEKLFIRDSDEEPNYVHRQVGKIDEKNQKPENKIRKSEERNRKSKERIRKSEERNREVNENEAVGPDSFLIALAKPDHYGIDSEVGMSTRSLLDLERMVEEDNRNVMFRSSLHISADTLHLDDSDEQYSNEEELYRSTSVRKPRSIVKTFVLPTKKSESEESDVDQFGFGKVTKRKILDLEEDIDDFLDEDDGAVGDSYKIEKTKIINVTKVEEETLITSYQRTAARNFSQWETETTTSEQKDINSNFGRNSIFQIKDETENDEEHMWEESEPDEESQISVLDRKKSDFVWDGIKDEIQDEEVPNGNESPGEVSGSYKRFDYTDDDLNKTRLRVGNNDTKTMDGENASGLVRETSENELDWLDVNEINLRRAQSWGYEMIDHDDDKSDNFNWNDDVKDEIVPDTRRPSIPFSRVPKVYEKMEELEEFHETKGKEYVAKRRESDFDWKDESPFRTGPKTESTEGCDFGNSLEASGSSGTIKKQTKSTNPIPVEEERELFESILNRKKREITTNSSIEESEGDEQLHEDDLTLTTQSNSQKNTKTTKKNKNKKKNKKGEKENKTDLAQTDPSYLLKESMYPFY